MQSLYNKTHLLEAFLETEFNKYSIICISETWFTEVKCNLVHFNDYKISTFFCRKSRQGGGVCIINHKSCPFEEINEIKEMSIEYVIEVCAINVVNDNLIILTTYWNGRETDVFYKQLELILVFITTRYKKSKIIIGGDFNVNILE